MTPKTDGPRTTQAPGREVDYSLQVGKRRYNEIKRVYIGG